jgi:hypothetical protein
VSEKREKHSLALSPVDMQAIVGLRPVCPWMPRPPRLGRIFPSEGPRAVTDLETAVLGRHRVVCSGLPSKPSPIDLRPGIVDPAMSRPSPDEFLPLPDYSCWLERPADLPLDVEECATAIYLAKGDIGAAAARLKVTAAKLNRLVRRCPRLQRLRDDLAGS